MRILKYKSENFEKEASSNMPGREEQAALIEMKPSKRAVEAIAGCECCVLLSVDSI